MLAIVLSCSLVPPALATVGEQHRAATQPSAALRDAQHRSNLRITIWYPAKPGAPTTTIDVPPEKPLFMVGRVAMDAPFADTVRHPVVLLSHGFGGTARIMGWFGTALAEKGYVVVAVDHPGNNGIDPQTAAGSVLWWDRADDLKLALETVLADPELGSHVNAARVGVAGFSIGGLTALVAGGARTDPAKMLDFCRTHPDDGTCKPQLEFPLTIAQNKAALADPALITERARASHDHTIPGVKAVFAMAPVVQPLTPASLRAIHIPTAIVVGVDDVTVPAETQANVARKLIPGATLAMLPGVTHYSFLATCSNEARETLAVCRKASQQQIAHRVAIDTALTLFDRAIGKSSL
jgi:predicted dienelactone hydrolase